MSQKNLSLARSQDVGQGEARKTSDVDRVTVYLHAGQLFASSEACEVSMVLGSCVAVCLFDPSLGIGGANHYLLPMLVAGTHASARFGNVAITELIARVISLGSKKSNLRAKIFGGAALMNADGGRNPTESLGWKNVQVARSVVGAEGIPVVAEDVGGFGGRKLLFQTDAGHAWVKRL